VGDSTKDASESQFDRLITQRQAKAYELLKWKGKNVTVDFWGRGLTGASSYNRSRTSQILKDCNQFYVTVEQTVGNRVGVTSYPLSSTELSFDHGQNQLRLEINE
jgi:hypothetical protein